jgi:hypothetical protein
LETDGKAALDEPFPGTMAFQKLQDYEFYGDQPVEIATIQLNADRMPKEIFYIPALLLLIVVVLVQRRRMEVPAF